MSMTWGLLRKRFLSAVGEVPAGEQEAWEHLTEGYRRLCRHVDVPELQGIATVDLADTDQSFDFDCDAYAIKSIFNATDGFLMSAEEGGFAGRQRFLEPATSGDPSPPVGTPSWWVRTGNKVWVRDAADGAKHLQVHYEIQPAAVDASATNEHPVTPAQYDRVILHFAAASFFASHPTANRPMDESGTTPSRASEQAAFALINDSAAKAKEPREIETRAEKTVVRLGYRITPRTSRSGRR